MIKEHNHDLRAWAIYARNDSQLTVALVDALYAIGTRPLIAEHAISLTIEHVHGPGERNYSFDHIPHAVCAPQKIAVVADMMRNSPWLRAAECDVDAWVALLPGPGTADMTKAILDDDDKDDEYGTCQGDQDDVLPAVIPLLTLLLSHLVRLETLTIGYNLHFPQDDEGCGSGPLAEAKRVLNLMSIQVSDREDDANASEGVNSQKDSPFIRRVQANRAVAMRSSMLATLAKMPPSPFENLSELHFCPPVGYHQRKLAVGLNTFITSPRLRSLFATSIQAASDGHFGAGYHWPMTSTRYAEPGNNAEDIFGSAEPCVLEKTSSVLVARTESAIEHLELVGACFGVWDFSDMLSYMPHLTTFRYTHEPKWEVCELDFNAGWFIIAICRDDNSVDPEGAYESDDEQDWSDEDGENDEEDGEDGDERTNGDQEADIEDKGSDMDAENEDQQSERTPHPHDGHLISKFDSDEPRLAQQITDLSIGFEDDNWADTVTTGVTGWMLAKFASLQILAIDVRMSFGPDPKTGEKFGYEACPPTIEGAAPWFAETNLPRLIDYLPETLQDLELLVGFSVEWRSGARGHHPRHWTHLLDGFTA